MALSVFSTRCIDAHGLPVKWRGQLLNTFNCFSFIGRYLVLADDKNDFTRSPDLLEKGGVQNIDPQGRFFERAICRSLLSRWNDNHEAETSGGDHGA